MANPVLDISSSQKAGEFTENTLSALKSRVFALRKESIRDRKQRLRLLETWIHANRERIQQAVHADYQKPILEVDTSEIYPVLVELRHVLKHLDQWASPAKIDAPLAYIGTRSEVRYEPKGTCLIMAPWNFPFNLCIGPLVSCLAAGNNAVIKPSEWTPNTSRLIREMITEIFPPDVVIVVEGGEAESRKLLEFPFDHIFFTGSTAVGKLVMQAASKHLSSVTLELGGKSPTVIDHTADLDDAAKRIAFGKFLNNGQTCIAPDYVLIDKRIEQSFINLVKGEIKRLFGDGKEITEASASYSRLATSRQFDRVSSLLADATERGATIDSLGPVNKSGQFMGPVLLTNVPPDARIWGEEIFGPVLPIRTYQTPAEAIEFINQGPKPLALYVFSKRKEFQEALLTETSSGSACINDCVLQFTHPNLPFGGVNNSGIGKSHGQFGFLTFSNEKSVLRQKSGWAGPYLLHPPYTKKMKRIVDILLKWF